jgi:hypothetical protein
MILKIFIWILILAYFHSRQETEIEGKAGWARHLPTFRISVFITKLFLAKEITGYHIYLLLMFLTIFHGIFLFIPFTMKNEFIVLGLLNYYWVLEDFLFFIVNPHFGISKFRKGCISWHKRWCIFNLIPVSYFWGLIIGTGLLILGR